ncbi:peptidase M14 [Bradyrhizobium sp. 83002]|uniref:M14 family metallopeptidase n=1 Tax=Bradyrhizobium aeschynomenes TaxID=2734909 RepID=UPI0015529C9A|nr:M14 family metallopeptidase [Bradyrhizobium aeschynomenes]NPU14584.1 peptidase M14 [Bradyrhizobium aeschynomenes]
MTADGAERAACPGESRPLSLARFDHFPDVLLDVPASELWRHLPGPSLFDLPGRQSSTLFVSVLLHGNEDTGWRAIQTVLRRARGRPQARAIKLLVGNVAAARAGVRTLPGQHDYNRAWPGTAESSSPEAAVMREVVASAAGAQLFASIDIHNNTGNNPHYACVNRCDDDTLQLARLFGRTVVYFEEPVGVQSAALSRLCPAITVECGQPGAEAGVAHAVELIEAALTLQHFPGHPVGDADIDLMRTFAIIKVPAAASFSFDGSDADFRFRPDLDHLNFAELEAGVSFGTHAGTCRLEVVAAEDGDDYFDYGGGDIRLAQDAIPAMLTRDPDAVRLDCLGYLMHRIGRDGRRLNDPQRSRK